MIIAEEIRDASDTLPRSIFWGVVLNVILGYLAVLTLCFTITDPSAILNTPTKYPFIQLFYNITNSYVGTDIMVAIIVIALVCAVIAEIATASRQIWSFARDGGLPFSPFLSKVRMPSSAFPVSNQLSSYCHLHLLEPINLRHKTPSTEARSNTRGYDSVGLPKLPHPPQRSHSLLPLRRRHQPNQPRFRRRSQRHHLPHHLRPPSLLRALPPARWSLGRAGMAVNIIALVKLVPFFVFCFFPTATPVQPDTMNWNIVMFGGIFLWATVFYALKGRKTYIPPVRIVKRDI